MLSLLESLPALIRLISSIIKSFERYELNEKIKLIHETMIEAKEARSDEEVKSVAVKIAKIWASNRSL
jgi:hypothetical protein